MRRLAIKQRSATFDVDDFDDSLLALYHELSERTLLGPGSEAGRGPGRAVSSNQSIVPFIGKLHGLQEHSVLVPPLARCLWRGLLQMAGVQTRNRPGPNHKLSET